MDVWVPRQADTEASTSCLVDASFGRVGVGIVEQFCMFSCQCFEMSYRRKKFYLPNVGILFWLQNHDHEKIVGGP